MRNISLRAASRVLIACLAASIGLDHTFAARVVARGEQAAKDAAGFRYDFPDVGAVENGLDTLEVEDVRVSLDRAKDRAGGESKKDKKRGNDADTLHPGRSGLVQVSNPERVKRALDRSDNGAPFLVELDGPGLVRLKLPKLSKEKATPGSKSKVSFYSFSIKPALAEDGEAVSIVSVAGALIGFRFEKSLGPHRYMSLLAANGDIASKEGGEWIDTGVRFPLSEDFQAQMPMELTFRIDPKAGEWDLYFMNRLLLGGLYLTGKDKGLWALSEGEGKTLLSHMLASDYNPLFEDEDCDGIEDSFESELGFSTETDDRRELDELNEYTLIQHFINAKRQYRSPAQKELEATLDEALILDELGESDEAIAHRKIPPELRQGTPTLEEMQEDVRRRSHSMRQQVEKLGRAPRLPQRDNLADGEGGEEL